MTALNLDSTHPAVTEIVSILDHCSEPVRSDIAVAVAVRALALAGRSDTPRAKAHGERLLRMARELETVLLSAETPGADGSAAALDGSGKTMERAEAARLITELGNDTTPRRPVKDEGSARNWQRSFPPGSVDGQSWILDVLADLADFADWSGLSAVSTELDLVRGRVASRIGACTP